MGPTPDQRRKYEGILQQANEDLGPGGRITEQEDLALEQLEKTD